MSTLLYDQYFCTWSAEHGGAAVVSSTAPENNDEMLKIHQGMNECGISVIQCCRLQYSSRLERYLWIRSVGSEDNSNIRRTYITHILHTSEPNESLMAAARLSLLPDLERMPPSESDPGRLVFDLDPPSIPVEIDYQSLKGYIYTMLFDFPRGKGLVVVCPNEKYNDYLARLVEIQYRLMPKRLAHSVSVTMNPRKAISSSLINIVTEYADPVDLFLLRVNGQKLMPDENPVGNPIRSAVCKYLADLLYKERLEYNSEIGKMVDWLSITEGDRLPPDSYLYCRWAEIPGQIILNQSVTDAVSTFLDTASLGTWKTLTPDRFFETLHYLCNLYLDGFENCNDTDPSKQQNDYCGLIKLLSGCRFPKDYSYDSFLAELIKFIWNNESKKNASTLFFTLHTLSSDDSNRVYSELQNRDLDLLEKMVESLTISDLGDPDKYFGVIWSERFKDKACTLLRQTLVNPYLIGNISEAEKQLKTAVATVGEKRPDWLNSLVENFIKDLYNIISDNNAIVNEDLNVHELVSFRCRNLHDVFGINSEPIAASLLKMYRNDPGNSKFRNTVTEICDYLGMNHYTYEQYLEVTFKELAEYVINYTKSIHSLCIRLCLIHELISARKNVKGNRNEMSVLYYRCLKEAFGNNPRIVTSNYSELSTLVEGTFAYKPVYENSKAAPFNHSVDALKALFHMFSQHLKEICNGDIEKEDLIENALTTVMMVKTERAIAKIEKSNSRIELSFNIETSEYDEGFFELLLDRDAFKPDFRPYLISKEILLAMREEISYIAPTFVCSKVLMVFTKICLTTIRILFNDTANLDYMFVKLGYKNALYAIVFAAIIAESSDDNEVAESVNAAYKQYKKTFGHNNIRSFFSQYVSNVVCDLYKSKLLTVPLHTLKAKKLNSELKKAINRGISAVENRQEQDDGSQEPPPLSKRVQRRLAKLQMKADELTGKLYEAHEAANSIFFHTDEKPNVSNQEKNTNGIVGTPQTELSDHNNRQDTSVSEKTLSGIISNTEQPEETVQSSHLPVEQQPHHTQMPSDPFSLPTSSGKDQTEKKINNNELNINEITNKFSENSVFLKQDDYLASTSLDNYNKETLEALESENKLASGGNEGKVLATENSEENAGNDGEKSSFGNLSIAEICYYPSQASDEITVVVNESDIREEIPSRINAGKDSLQPEDSITDQHNARQLFEDKDNSGNAGPVVSADDVSEHHDTTPPFPETEQESPSVLSLLITILSVAALTAIMALSFMLAASDIRKILAVLASFTVLSASMWMIGLLLSRRSKNKVFRTVYMQIKRCIIIFAPILIFTVLLLCFSYFV